jgi:hypothetical protein
MEKREMQASKVVPPWTVKTSPFTVPGLPKTDDHAMIFVSTTDASFLYIRTELNGVT